MFDEQLHFYARKNTYVYTPQSYAKILYSKTQSNDLCTDVLTIHIIKDTPSHKNYKALHCGSYCTLVHLSCELLCEIISQSPHNQWSLLLENITNANKNTINSTSENTKNEALEIFLQLYTKTISKQRRACLMLPYKILTKIIHTMNTE